MGAIEQWKNPGCFGFVGEFTTRLCGDFEINHYYESKSSFFVAQVSPSLRTRYVPAKLWISRNLGKHLLKFVQHIPFQTLTRLDTETIRLKCLQLGAEAGSLLREHAWEKARLRGQRDLTKACPRTVLDTAISFDPGLRGAKEVLQPRQSKLHRCPDGVACSTGSSTDQYGGRARKGGLGDLIDFLLRRKGNESSPDPPCLLFSLRCPPICFSFGPAQVSWKNCHLFSYYYYCLKRPEIMQLKQRLYMVVSGSRCKSSSRSYIWFPNS